MIITDQQNREGIPWKYDGDPPFNIALRPRLVSTFKQRDLIETVINLKIFAKYYSNEKEYRTKLQKIFNVRAKRYGNQTKNVIRNRLLAATRQEFDELLE